MCLAGLICLRFPSRTPLLSFLLSGHRAQAEHSGGGGVGGGVGGTGGHHPDSRNQRQAWPAPGFPVLPGEWE